MMIQKLKTLIFSTTILTMGAFSAQAMENPWEALDFPITSQKILKQPSYSNEEQTQVYSFCERYNLAEWLVEDVYHEVKGKAFALNEYGVPHVDYIAAFLFYNKRRVPGEFQLLYDLFTKMPVDKRKDAFSELNAWAAYGTGRTLGEFYVDSEGKEEAIDFSRMRDEKTTRIQTIKINLLHKRISPTQSGVNELEQSCYDEIEKLRIENGRIRLEDKLLTLPYEPKRM
ncbi:MAG: hypothetical protein H0X26_02175 [Alphaproteobacteria bacterium]|nr:hypothetical protein [Alphaproteobacteria bacterium]